VQAIETFLRQQFKSATVSARPSISMRRSRGQLSAAEDR